MPIVLKHKRIPNIYDVKIPPEGFKLNDTWTLLSIERLPPKEDDYESESMICFNFKVRNIASGMESFETILSYMPSDGKTHTSSEGYSINQAIPSNLTNPLQILTCALTILIHVAVAYHIGCSFHNQTERTSRIFKKKE